MKNYREPLTAEEKETYKGGAGAPSVYVGTYKKYNEGSINGMWVDLSMFDDYDEFIEFCKRLHADERDPELMFQDYENFPQAYYGESHIDFDYIKEWSDLHDSLKDAFEAYLELHEDASLDDFEDAYVGEYDDVETFAEEIISECYDLRDVPDIVLNHVDWSRVWNELNYDGYEENNGYFFRQY